MPFLYCCKTAKVWRARISLYRKDYKIRLVRDMNANRCCGCCEQYKVVVNKREIEHDIKYTPCSSLCGYGGQYEYEWQQDGHTFLFVLNTVSFTSPSGKHRLYVNGVDVSSGKEYSEFWNRPRMATYLYWSVYGYAKPCYDLVFDRCVWRGS